MVSSTNNISIRFAQARERPFLQRHLAQAFAGQPQPTALIATDPTEQPVGGATLRQLPGPEREARFLLWVEPAQRRQGIGSGLVEGLIQLARQQGAARLVSGRSVTDDMPERAFCEAAGLRKLHTIAQYVTPNIQRYKALMEGYAARLPAPPPGVEEVGLTAVDPDQLTTFILTHLGGIGAAIRANLADRQHGYQPELSVLLRHAGELIGVYLVKRNSLGYQVEVICVAPAYRRGWANILLHRRAAEKLMQVDGTLITFSADVDKHRDTVKIARRVGAELVEERFLYGAMFGDPTT